MQFKYKVIDEKMNVAEGRLEAVDYEAAKRIVRGNGWQLLFLKEAKPLDSILNRKIQEKVKYDAVASFCSQLAMTIRSGANLVRGLEVLQAQMEDKSMRSVLETIIRGVSRGDSLSQAMLDCHGALPELLVNLVAVGEESGNLESVLTSMARYYERESFIRKKIHSAAIYPVMLIFVLIGLILFFLNFILPDIQDLIVQNGQQLPMMTQLILDLSRFLTTYGLYLLIGGILLSFLLVKLLKQLPYRYHWDKVLLRIPLLGKNLKNVILARFTRTLALFLHSSIPMVPILNSIEKIVGNEVPKRAVSRVRERIIQGEPLALAFGKEGFFDPLVIQMMSIGEETGRLEELMADLANHYDQRVEIGITRMVSLVEPIFTVIIGVFAGGLIISIALPIFNMANVVNK